MAGIQIEQATDLLTATLAKFKPNQFEIALESQTAEIVNRWFKTDKMVVSGGDRCQFFIQLKRSNNATHTRLYDTDDVNVANVMTEGNVNWTHVKTAWAYDVREIAMNKGNPQRIFSMLEARIKAAHHDLIIELEQAAWRTPSSSTDDLSPFGIPGWLAQGDDGETGDFTGFLPDFTTADDTESAFSTVAGISCSSTVNPLWASFYADHNNLLDDNLLKLLSRAVLKSHFETPTVAGEALDPKSNFSNFRYYTSSNVILELEELARKSDDRVGYDLGKYAGATIFKGVPFKWVADLDTELTYVRGADPIYGINHNHFYPIVLSDNNFRKTKPTPKSGSHNVLEGFVDLTYAYVCDNRRTGGFLISDRHGAN